MAGTATIDQHPPLSEEEIAFFYAEMAKLVTEDDTPVDNIFSERQQRLLTETLYATTQFPGGERPFIALANVGLFYAMHLPPLVPDVLLSLDVHLPDEVWSKHHRSYFIWMYGKPPDVVIEIVSNTEGNELGDKRATYAQIGIPYYVAFDPNQELKEDILHVFALLVRSYVERADNWFPEVGLGLTLWHGTYEGYTATWLRWCYEDGALVLTGAERAEQERERAEQERERAEQERERAEQERERADRLAAQLRALGVEPQE